MLRPGLAGAMVTKTGTARAKTLLRAALARGTGIGGPLVVTIGTTINMEDLDDVPDEVVDDIEADIHEIMENTMVNTVAEARSLAPIRTGKLRASINGQSDEEALMITFIANTDYAIYQEDGTSKMSPNPYLRGPAAEGEADMNAEIEEVLADRLDNNVDGDEENVDLEIETTYEGFSESQLAELAGIIAE
jgi:HK97 gp10 family phage protein